MKFENYTEDAILEIYELAIKNKKYQKYLPEIKKVIKDRLKPHEHSVEIFSKYGIIPEMFLTTKDFTDSCE